MLKQILAALAILGLATLGMWLLWPEGESGNDEPQRGGRDTAVNTIAPERQTLADILEAVGTTTARDAVNITSEVDGRVVELRFAEGDRVEEGEVLLVLDERQARADLAVAQARHEDARDKFARAERLRPTNNISEAEFDERRSQMRVAEAELEAARTRLANRRVEAPFTGTLGLRDVSRGAYLRAGDVITTLDTIEQLDLNFSVPERFIGRLELGQTVQGRTDALPGEVFKGEVRELDSRVDQRSRSLAVRAFLDNSERLLRPGQFLNVNLRLGEREALMVPEQAVLAQGNEHYLYVVEDGKAQRRNLTLGERRPGTVEIRDGLDEHDRVIITGLGRLGDGDAVRVLEDPDVLVPTNRVLSGEH